MADDTLIEPGSLTNHLLTFTTAARSRRDISAGLGAGHERLLRALANKYPELGRTDLAMVWLIRHAGVSYGEVEAKLATWGKLAEEFLAREGLR